MLGAFTARPTASRGRTATSRTTATAAWTAAGSALSRSRSARRAFKFGGSKAPGLAQTQVQFEESRTNARISLDNVLTRLRIDIQVPIGSGIHIVAGAADNTWARGRHHRSNAVEIGSSSDVKWNAAVGNEEWREPRTPRPGDRSAY